MDSDGVYDSEGDSDEGPLDNNNTLNKNCLGPEGGTTLAFDRLQVAGLEPKQRANTVSASAENPLALRSSRTKSHLNPSESTTGATLG